MLNYSSLPDPSPLRPDRIYRQYITGAAPELVYRVPYPDGSGGYPFHGFRDGACAYTIGVANQYFDEIGDPLSETEFERVFVTPAREQLRAANGSAKIIWYCQEGGVAQSLVDLFDERDITGITILHAP